MAILLVGQSNYFILLRILLIISASQDVVSKDYDDDIGRGGLSLKELADSEGLTKLFASDGYFMDTSQEKVKPFDGINIKYEAQKLSASLRWISNDEIGVTTMQVCLGGASCHFYIQCLAVWALTA